MRGYIVMAMFAASLSYAGSHDYSEVRDLELDASGLSNLSIDDVEYDLIIEEAGSGVLRYTNVHGTVRQDD